MIALRPALLLIAIVLAVLAALNVPSGRVGLLAASVACFEASELVG